MRAGLLLVDKTEGLSSFQVTSAVKKRLRVGKAGHAGTLDPLATGLLPVLLGPATRLAEYLSDADKVYEAQIFLGRETDTLDREGAVVAERPLPGDVTEDKVALVCQRFVGQVVQQVPAFSAVRVGGRRLYKMARRGDVPQELPRRLVHIHEIRLLGFEPPIVTVRVTCGKGTYIRTLAADLARSLGTVGHLRALRRLGVGRLGVEQAVTLAEFLEAEDPWMFVRPAVEALGHIPVCEVSSAVAARLGQGQFVPEQEVPGLAGVSGSQVALSALSGDLLVVAGRVSGQLRPIKVLHLDG